MAREHENSSRYHRWWTTSGFWTETETVLSANKIQSVFSCEPASKHLEDATQPLLNAVMEQLRSPRIRSAARAKITIEFSDADRFVIESVIVNAHSEIPEND